MKFSLYLMLLLFCFTSCRIIPLGGDQIKELPSQPLLGTVGHLQQDISSANFTESGVPHLKERIKLSIQKKPFLRKSYRKYNKKVGLDEERFTMVDSMDRKEYFYLLEISDKVGVIEALNSQEANNLRTLIEVTQDQVMLTSVNIYFPPEVADNLEQASEVYLVNNKKSSYSLELLKKDKKNEIIEFGEGISFGYGFSGFCWIENYKKRRVIAAFRKTNKSCPGTTEKDPEKLRTKVSFDKLWL